MNVAVSRLGEEEGYSDDSLLSGYSVELKLYFRKDAPCRHYSSRDSYKEDHVPTYVIDVSLTSQISLSLPEGVLTSQIQNPLSVEARNLDVFWIWL